MIKNKNQTRPRKRELSLDKIAEAALHLLRDKGEDALTMRSVAEACGVTAMAIYHHVSDKETLATIVIDRLFQQAAASPSSDSDWRSALTRLWIDIRQRLLDVPGAGTIFVRRAVIGPGTARLSEEMFRLLSQGGIEGTAAAEAADAMTMLCIGSIANELSRPPKIRERLVEQAPTEDLPHLMAHIEAYAVRDSEARYRVALSWLIEGVARGATPSRPIGGKRAATRRRRAN